MAEMEGGGDHWGLNQIDCECQSPVELRQFGPRKGSDVLREHRFWNTRQAVTPNPILVLHAFAYPKELR